MAPLTVCGKLLSPADRRVWQQALAMLIGLKRRNGFGDNELTAAVKAVLHQEHHAFTPWPVAIARTAG